MALFENYELLSKCAHKTVFVGGVPTKTILANFEGSCEMPEMFAAPKRSKQVCYILQNIAAPAQCIGVCAGCLNMFAHLNQCPTICGFLQDCAKDCGRCWEGITCSPTGRKNSLWFY